MYLPEVNFSIIIEQLLCNTSHVAGAGAGEPHVYVHVAVGLLRTPEHVHVAGLRAHVAGHT